MLFRRVSFRAKVPEPVLVPQPEPMKPRVDVETIAPTPTMAEFAKQIVQNPAFEQTIKYLRQEIMAEMVATRPSESPVREACYARITALDGVMSELDKLAHSGPLTRTPKEK